MARNLDKHRNALHPTDLPAKCHKQASECQLDASTSPLITHGIATVQWHNHKLHGANTQREHRGHTIAAPLRGMMSLPAAGRPPGFGRALTRIEDVSELQDGVPR